MPPSGSIQEMLTTSLQHARWLNRQFLIFTELKRRDVLARQANQAWWANAPAPVDTAPQEEENDDDWIVV